MRTFRIALIGYGAIGRVHAHGYRALPFLYGVPPDFAQVVAVATSRPETAEAAARELGCAVWSGDYLEIVARDDVDVIDCYTPNGAHHDIVIAAAQAGKHIYCEKPLALDVAQGLRMLAAAEAAGVATQMTFNFRFFPAITHARQLIDEGFVGRVYSFRARYYRSRYIDPQLPISWKLRMRDSGGGALVDLGSHALDLVSCLLGRMDSVQATLETVIRERPVARGSSEMAPVDVDDLALMHVRLATGSTNQGGDGRRTTQRRRRRLGGGERCPAACGSVIELN